MHRCIGIEFESVPFRVLAWRLKDRMENVSIFFHSAFKLETVKILQKFFVRNVQFPFVSFRVLGITYKFKKMY